MHQLQTQRTNTPIVPVAIHTIIVVIVVPASAHVMLAVVVAVGVHAQVVRVRCALAHRVAEDR